MTDKNTGGKPTLDQRRAEHAWKAVRGVVDRNARDKERARKFGGQARKLPTRIIASGLGQALAFLKAKDYAPDLLIELVHVHAAFCVICRSGSWGVQW